MQLRNSSNPVIKPQLTCKDHELEKNDIEKQINDKSSGSTTTVITGPGSGISGSGSTDLVVCPLDGCLFSAGGLRGVAYDWLRDNLIKYVLCSVLYCIVLNCTILSCIYTTILSFFIVRGFF